VAQTDCSAREARPARELSPPSRFESMAETERFKQLKEDLARLAELRRFL